jgi:hypothetical protein
MSVRAAYWESTYMRSPSRRRDTYLVPTTYLSTIPTSFYVTRRQQPLHFLFQQQQQHKKLGIIIHYLDQFNHNRSLHTPRAQGQTQTTSQSENHWRGLLSFQDFRLGTYGYAAIQLLFLNTPSLNIDLDCCDWLSLYSLQSACFPCGLNG